MRCATARDLADRVAIAAGAILVVATILFLCLLAYRPARSETVPVIGVYRRS